MADAIIYEFREYLDDVRQNALYALSDNSSAYKELKGKQKNLEEIIMKTLDGLNDSDRKTAYSYIETESLIAKQEKEHLYLAGYEDCVALLKYLRVL